MTNPYREAPAREPESHEEPDELDTVNIVAFIFSLIAVALATWIKQ